MEVILTLTTCAILLILSEIYAFFSLEKRGISSQFLLDIKKIRSKNTIRQKILKDVLKHYMAFDSNLGLKMKANTKSFRFKKKKNFRSKTKSVKIGNFFEIETDNYGFICNEEGQNRNYPEISNDDKIFRILVMGNSVTAGSGASKGSKTWPSLLEAQMNENINSIFNGKYEKVVVINSGGLGHKMSHELRRLQDELIFLKPHLVISFSGCYANYDYKGSPIIDSNHDIQNNFNKILNYPLLCRQDILFPSLVSLFRKKQDLNISNSIPDLKEGYLRVSAYENTLTKIKQIKAVCDASNVNFLFCLQPIMGYGNKRLTKAEERLKNDFEKYFFDTKWESYNANVIHYLNNLIGLMNDNYQHDLTGIFDDIEKTVFSDPRHQNDLGHKIISDNIYKIASDRISKFNNKESGINIKLERSINDCA